MDRVDPHTSAVSVLDAQPSALCFDELIGAAAGRDPDALALWAPGRGAITYGRLYEHTRETVRTLNSVGIGRGDRVATVMQNGPEMAAAFLGIAAGAACAPLNPAYRRAEFDFYLADLRPKAAIVDAEPPAAIHEAAQALGIPLIRVASAAEGEHRVFHLEHGLPHQSAIRSGPAGPHDVALLLHTSGTTSRPKLVPLTHANLCHSARHIGTALALTPADRCLNIMPLFHIHGLVAAVLSSLAACGSVVCCPGFVATRFFEWLDEFHPTWFTAVPTMHQAILARAAANSEIIGRNPLRFLRSCSAPLPPQVMAGLEAAFGAPVIESYGMTEAAHQMSSNPLPPLARKPGSVGKPAGPQVAIMDEAGELLAPGASGEIVIRGPNVTPGYDRNDEANQRAFTNGWFRTGDLGYFDEDGYLFIRGRTKELINRGGEKIAPREIDEALMDHPAVAHALAFAMPDDRLGEEVAAAVVLREGAQVTEFDLRQFASARLADFKVPKRIVFLKEIPKGPTGKPQRIGLAAKLELTDEKTRQDGFVAPRTSTEAAVCEIWRSVLRSESVGVCEDFFGAGGDSILAAQVLARVRETTGIEMPFVAFFAAPTVEAMAKWLDSAAAGSKAAPPPLMPGSKTAEAPLSFAQERIWFLSELEPEATPYVRAAAFRLTGELDLGALERSIARIVERHEALRTTFDNRNGAPVQVISPPGPVLIEQLDFSGLPETERLERVRQLAAQQAHQPFALSRDLMLRASLVRLGARDHCLIVAMHHIASDGWSTGIFLQELAALYRAFSSSEPDPLPELRVQYRDYASWQKSWLRGQALAEQLSYWKEQLSGLPPLLPLPYDWPRPARQTYAGARESLVLDAGLAEALAALCRREQVTLFMVLAAGLQVLLSRISGNEDIAIGFPAAGRSQLSTESLIGLFVNTLVLRTDLSGNPEFRQALARVREAALGAYAHQDMPFEKLVQELQPVRSLSYSPLFQVMFQVRNLPFETPCVDGLRVEPLEFDPGVAPFDLSLEVAPQQVGLRCVLDYNTALFHPGAARRFLQQYRVLLESVAQDPATRIGSLPLLTDEARAQVLANAAGPKRELPEAEPVASLFETRAAAIPEGVAVIHGREQWTYAQLNDSANRIAHRLRRLGVSAGVPVAIFLERSPESVVAILAILKAGGAFLPLDIDYPRQRIAFMLEDAQPPVLITQTPLLPRLPQALPHTILLDSADLRNETAADASVQADSERVAYVIYTSGSTGAPKGVLGLERGLLNRLHWMWRCYPYSEGEVCCQRTPLGFVDSIAEILGPILAGVPLFIVPSEVVKGSPAELIRVLDRAGITRLTIVPSLLAAMLETVDGPAPVLPRLKYCFSSGETLSAGLASRFCRLLPSARLVNIYGSSEVSADVTWHEFAPDRPDERVPVGRPIDNSEVYILDGQLQPVPPGVAGEICVGGAGLAAGYLNGPELTRERFIANPFGSAGAKLFRTGDRGRYLPDGSIEFLGRADGQVKLNGCRIELAEVEAALSRHPVIAMAAVAVRNGTSSPPQLVAYTECRDGRSVTPAELRSFLSETLPAFMIPSQYVSMPALPLLLNGKVDRRSLPEPALASHATAVAPRNEEESRLAAIWRDLLGRSPIGVHDNFFDLGGHSLLAMRLAARIEDAFGRALPLAALFEGPTIAQLAAVLRNGSSPAYLPRVFCVQKGTTEPPTLFCFGGGDYAQPLAQKLGSHQPVFCLSLEQPDLRALPQPYTVEHIASLLVESLRRYQPEGPYYLAGYSLQGLYAYEAARQLEQAGQEVRLLALFDTVLPKAARGRMGFGPRARAHLLSLARQLGTLQCAAAVRHVQGLAAMLKRPAVGGPATPSAGPGSLADILRAAAAAYIPSPYAGRLVFFEAAAQPLAPEVGARFGWADLARGGLTIWTVPGEHLTIFNDTALAHMEGVLSRLLS